MKTTIRIFASVLAASLVFVSCAKQEAMDNGNTDSVGGTRTIVLSFANASVKSELGEDGLTPNFIAGDVIKFSNGIDTPENCTIRVDDSGQASINTRLVGDLTAVYPAAAAKMNGNDIGGIMVPTVQDGTFASANIFKASIDEDATSASFENQTAILRFYVDASIGVKSITVSSTAADIAYGSKTITVDPEGDVTLDAVTDDPGRRICYVSVLPVAESTDLTFSSVTTTQTAYPDNTVSRTVSSTTMEKNKMYNAFIPYYIDFGTAGKWAYCNIGAFLPEDYGYYFPFYNISGRVPNSDNSGWVLASDNTTAMYFYVDYPQDGDPAKANWGDDWKMPSGGEWIGSNFSQLADACLPDGFSSSSIAPTLITNEPASQGVYYYNVEGSKGLYFVDATGNKLFFPAAGYGNDQQKLINAGSLGFYWSDTPSTTFLTGYGLLLRVDNVDLWHINMRANGFSARPIFNELSVFGLIPQQYNNGGSL